MKELMNVRMVENEEGGTDLLIDPDEAANGVRVDQLIQALVEIRGQLQPPRSKEMPQGMDGLSVVSDPGWFLAEAFPQGLTLGLWHPAYGWLGFQLTQKIREDLIRTLESAPPPEQPAAGH